MPLLDHFRPPVIHDIQWNTFHAVWAGTITDRLTQVVPSEFQVREHFKLGGGLEIDIAALQNRPPATGTDTPKASAWQPPEGVTVPATFPDSFEVLVFRQFGGRQLVAAIELVSPGNNDAPDTREAFVSKVVSYLHEGVSVLIVDVVTERRANLHNELVAQMRLPDALRLPTDPPLYATAYRPVLRDGRAEIDVWTSAFNVGDALPTMPLRLIADYFVPVELEATYMEACRRRRLVA